jgi:hypothetical protein
MRLLRNTINAADRYAPADFFVTSSWICNSNQRQPMHARASGYVHIRIINDRTAFSSNAFNLPNSSLIASFDSKTLSRPLFFYLALLARKHRLPCNNQEPFSSASCFR